MLSVGRGNGLQVRVRVRVRVRLLSVGGVNGGLQVVRCSEGRKLMEVDATSAVLSNLKRGRSEHSGGVCLFGGAVES